MMELLKLDEYRKLDTIDNPLPKEESDKYYYLKHIRIEDLSNLCVDILNEHSDEDKLNNANDIADLLRFMLVERGLLKPDVQQTFVDLLYVSCLLHNIISVNSDNWEDVFKIRKIIITAAKSYPQIPEQALDSICDTIENQLGEGMPIKGCKPNPNTPGELFAMAVAITNKFKK